MLGILAAAVMAISFFLPWVEIFGEQAGPSIIFEDRGPDLMDMPWQVWAFLGSFALAGLGAVLAVMRKPAGLVMLVAGAIPYGLIAQQVLGVRDRVQDVGLPLPNGGNPQQAFDMMREFMAIGLPAYFVSAAILVVVGVLRLIRGA